MVPAIGSPTTTMFARLGNRGLFLQGPFGRTEVANRMGYDHGLSPRMEKLRCEFDVAKRRIQSGHNRAEKTYGEETFDVFNCVWQLNRNDIPGTHTNPMQTRCNFRNPLF